MKDYKDIEDILIKHILGECSEEEIAQVVEWLGEEENRAAYEKLRKDIRRMGEVRKLTANVDVDAAWKKTSERLNLGNKSGGRVIPLFSPGSNFIRVAAAVLALITLYFLFRPIPDAQEPPLAETEDTSFVQQVEFTQYAAKNEKERVDLPEGSKVTLKGGSEIRYEISAADSIRKVHLDKGEAYFEVKRDEKKAFLVKTESAMVRVLGTKFNVDKKENGDVEVFVTEGLVRVYADSSLEKGKYIDLKKGEKAIRNLKGLFRVDDINLNSISWLTGHLKFNNAQMKEVIADLENHYNVEFEVEDLTFYHCRLTAKYKKVEITEILESLKLNFGINYEIRGDIVIITGKGCSEEAS